MKSTYVDFAAYQQEKLSDPHEAQAYLELAIEEYAQDADAGAFLLALRRVADAQGGMGRLAAEAGLNRQALYTTLSAEGNPRLDTLTRILKSLGFRLRVELASP